MAGFLFLWKYTIGNEDYAVMNTLYHSRLRSKSDCYKNRFEIYLTLYTQVKKQKLDITLLAHCKHPGVCSLAIYFNFEHVKIAAPNICS
jgi:hypothetical protein